MHTILTIFLALNLTANLYAQTEPGHSHLGAAFDQGPKTFAQIQPGQARIDFQPERCSQTASRFINQGISQLHGFLNYEAERSFRHAAYLDKDCVAAFWGIAMANIIWVNNTERAVDLINEARKRLTPLHSARTRLYIEAVEAVSSGDERLYAEKLRAIFKRYSWDLDAKAFHIVAVWSRDLYDQMGYTGPTVEIKKDAIFNLAREVLRENPAHPVHHYIVHMWDNPTSYKKAIASADVIGFSAPGIAHMWHMGGHIYDQANLPFEAWWSQEASARVDHRYMKGAQIFPFMLHNHAHNNEWLTRTLMKLGDFDKAWALALNLLAQPAHPSLNNAEDYRHLRTGAERTLDIIERGAYWQIGLQLLSSPLLQCSRYTSYKPVFTNCQRMQQLINLHNGQPVKLDSIPTIEYREEVDLATRVHNQDPNITLNEFTSLSHMQNDWEFYRFVKYAMQIQAHNKAMLTRLIDQDNMNVLFYLRAALGYASLGETSLAQQTLEKVRKISAKLDLNAPEVRSIISELKAYNFIITPDWRQHFQDWRDIHKKRPRLESLGPLLWKPTRAQNFIFIDNNGRRFNFFRLADNKPTLLVFVLNECQHCDEQVKLINDRRSKFAQLGINLVFVTSQSDNYGAYRQFRAFNDFEGFPLHGVFLIAGDKTILWEDISADAFLDIDFILQESRRLLHPLHRAALRGDYLRLRP